MVTSYKRSRKMVVMSKRKVLRNMASKIMQGFVSTRFSAVSTYMITFIVWLNLAYISTEGSVGFGGTCFDELIIHPCKGLYRSDKVIVDVEWKAKDSKSERWIQFAYCNGILTCIVQRPILPNGVKVTNISDGTLTLQPSATTMTDGITELKCLVHYSDSTINTPSVVKIHYSNFTVCIRAQRGTDVNFTRVLRSILPWQQVTDIELYDINKTKLAYCHTSNCTIIEEPIDGSDAGPTSFLKRLRVKDGSLLLIRTGEKDDGRQSRVKVHLNNHSVHLYPLAILVVKGSRGTEKASLTTATVTPAATPTAILTRTPIVKVTRTPVVKVTTTSTQTESTRTPPSWHPETPTTRSSRGLRSVSAVLGQEWTAVLIAVDVFLGIVVRDCFQ